MKKLILLFAILFLVPSCKKSEYYIRFYFYINNQTSYDLELFKDYEYSATIKKWRVEDADEEGKSIFRFSDYTLTDIYKHYRLHRATIHEEFIITITDEDIL